MILLIALFKVREGRESASWRIKVSGASPFSTLFAIFLNLVEILGISWFPTFITALEIDSVDSKVVEKVSRKVAPYLSSSPFSLSNLFGWIRRKVERVARKDATPIVSPKNGCRMNIENPIVNPMINDLLI